MSSTVIGLFDDYNDAQKAVSSLVAAGVGQDNIGLTTNQHALGHTGTEVSTNLADHEVHTSGAGGNALRGAFAGGAGGFLAGLALLAIPGVGPIAAAGPIVAAIAGASLGAATGGLLGALNSAGVPEEDAALYTEAVRRGGTLLTVYTDTEHSARVSTILDEFGAVDIDERRNYYTRTGYTGFHPDAPAYTPEQIVSEQNYHRGYNTSVPVATTAATETTVTPGTTVTRTVSDTIPAQPSTLTTTTTAGTTEPLPVSRGRARIHPRVVQNP